MTPWGCRSGSAPSSYRYLGDGVGGQVVEGVHRWLRHPAAIKVQWPKWVGDLEIAELFVQEAHVLRRLEGPGVPRAYDVGQLPDGRMYLATELIGGDSLGSQLARSRPRLPRDVAHVLAGTLDVLTRAHGAGVVHRNLKPAHLILNAEGVTVIDWGVAWVGAAAAPLRPTRGHMIVGTPRYMAPEQSRGGEVTPAADVYALGVIAFEALTGRPPFVDAAPLDAIDHQRHATAPPITSLNTDVPLMFERLVEAMLDKEPGNRPTPREVRAVLERLERDELRLAA